VGRAEQLQEANKSDYDGHMKEKGRFLSRGVANTVFHEIISPVCGEVLERFHV